MVNVKYIAQFIGVSLPTLFLILWSVDAPLMLGEDVFFCRSNPIYYTRCILLALS